MALIDCPGECNNKVSDEAPQCPNCGFPVREKIWEFGEVKLFAKGPMVRGQPQGKHYFYVDVSSPMGEWMEHCSPQFSPTPENFATALSIIANEMRESGWEAVLGAMASAPGGVTWQRTYRRKVQVLAPDVEIVCQQDEFMILIPGDAEPDPNAAPVLLKRGSSYTIIDVLLDQNGEVKAPKIRTGDGRVGFFNERTDQLTEQERKRRLDHQKAQDLQPAATGSAGCLGAIGLICFNGLLHVIRRMVSLS